MKIQYASLLLLTLVNGVSAAITPDVAAAPNAWQPAQTLSAAPANRALRNMLYDALDGKTARRLLADTFPGGSAEKHIQMMKKRAGNDDEDSVIRQLADELIAKAGYIQGNAA
ncbi:hypothetical protein [Yersinia bercovieri]|uniref:hypothetical protein n=1 Tax=Yersinia bercovieri TaxID=634 RepID=UPI001643CD9D|nr:hypothetical protein [Yersinia bercovieri]